MIVLGNQPSHPSRHIVPLLLLVPGCLFLLSLSPSLSFPFFSSSFPLLSIPSSPLSLLFPSSSLTSLFYLSFFHLSYFFFLPPLLLLLPSLSCPSPSNVLSSLFYSSKIESCFSSPHVSDFPEWQKVALSSPPPREAFVPPHLEPRVRVSHSCWQHVHVCTCTCTAYCNSTNPGY